MNSILRQFVCILIVMTAVQSLFAQAQEYRIVDLGTPDGLDSVALDVNDAGAAAGWVLTPDGARRAFSYLDGRLRNLAGSGSAATALNDANQVAGYADVNEFGSQFDPVRQGYLWETDSSESLGELYCPCDFNRRYGVSEAFGINDAGQVVGSSETVRGEQVRHAFLWEDGEMSDLGGEEGDWSISGAFDINNTAVVVGFYAENAGLAGVSVENPDAFERGAARWRDGQREDIGALPGNESSVALAINDLDQIVGWSGSLAAAASRAVLWSGEGISDLGTLNGDANSRALDINDNGQVVGWSGGGDENNRRAFLWAGGQMLDLNTLVPPDSGWILLEATAISNNGHIAGTGSRGGQQRAFILEPVTPLGEF